MSKTDPIVVVSGLPRSGTSMMMRMLSAAGYEILTDEIRSADEDNPRGYFELEAVKRTSQDPSWLDGAPGKAVKVISALLGDLPEGKPYKIIFMRRDLDEVLASQKKMLDHRSEDDDSSDDDMKEHFVAHLEEVEDQLRSRTDFDVLFVSYSRTVADPEKTARRVARFLDRDLPIESMAQAVDPTLYRNRGTGSGGSTP